MEKETDRLANILDEKKAEILRDIQDSYTSGILNSISLYNFNITLYLLCKEVFNGNRQSVEGFIKGLFTNTHKNILEKIALSIKKDAGEDFEELFSDFNEELQKATIPIFEDVLRSILTGYNATSNELSKDKETPNE